MSLSRTPWFEPAPAWPDAQFKKSQEVLYVLPPVSRNRKSGDRSSASLHTRSWNHWKTDLGYWVWASCGVASTLLEAVPEAPWGFCWFDLPSRSAVTIWALSEDSRNYRKLRSQGGSLARHDGRFLRRHESAERRRCQSFRTFIQN